MAYLDVSAALLSPAFTNRYTVNRRTQVVDPGSGVASTVDKPIKNVPCVVTAASGNDLERLDDNQRMGRNYVVITKFRLQGPQPGFQPDTIEIEGDVFVVKSLDPYPRYGAGFVQAIVGSMDLVDQPVP